MLVSGLVESGPVRIEPANAPWRATGTSLPLRAAAQDEPPRSWPCRRAVWALTHPLLERRGTLSAAGGGVDARRSSCSRGNGGHSSREELALMDVQNAIRRKRESREHDHERPEPEPLALP